MQKLTVGDLFSGIGGFSLGLERTEGFETKWFVEIDDFCLKVLAKHWPEVPKHKDILNVGEQNLEAVDLICGGFPCTPFSTAGKRRGAEDDRHLWPEMHRVIKEVAPRWVLLENVPGILSIDDGLVFESVLSDLENEGYETQAFIIPACGVDAPHRRDRVWVVAYDSNSRDGDKRAIKKIFSREQDPESTGICNGVPDANEQHGDNGRFRAGKTSQQQTAKISIGEQWGVKSEFCRVFNELSEELDRDRLTKPQRHDSMGLNQDKGENHAKAKESRPGKILQCLSKEDVSETIPKFARGHDSVQKKEILQPALHGSGNDARYSDACSIEEKSICIKGGCLRILWNGNKFEYSPYGFRPSEQREVKPENIVRFMSYFMALDARQAQRFLHEQAETLHRLRKGIAEIKTGHVPKTLSEVQEIWKCLSDQEKNWLVLRISSGNPFCAEWPDVPRASTETKNRTHRLKSLGNAVVPQVVEMIGRAIMECERGTVNDE